MGKGRFELPTPRSSASQLYSFPGKIRVLFRVELLAHKKLEYSAILKIYVFDYFARFLFLYFLSAVTSNPNGTNFCASSSVGTSILARIRSLSV